MNNFSEVSLSLS